MVWRRSVDRGDILRDRAETEIGEAGTAFHIDENVFLGEVSRQSGTLADALCVRLSNPRGQPHCYADS